MDEPPRNEDDAREWFQGLENKEIEQRISDLENEIVRLRTAISIAFTTSLKATRAAGMPQGTEREQVFHEIHAQNHLLFRILTPKRPIGHDSPPEESGE